MLITSPIFIKAIPPIINKLVGTWLEGENIIKCGLLSWTEVECSQSSSPSSEFTIEMMENEEKKIYYEEQPSTHLVDFRFKGRVNYDDDRGTLHGEDILEWHSSNLENWERQGNFQNINQISLNVFILSCVNLILK